MRLQAGILLVYFPLLIDYYPAYVPFSQVLVCGTPREDHKLQEAVRKGSETVHCQCSGGHSSSSLGARYFTTKTNRCCELINDILAQYTIPQELRPVYEAHYDPEREECLEGTRAMLLENLVKWMQSVDDDAVPKQTVYAGLPTKSIAWIYGMAGSGKSTIAVTVAALAKQQGFQVSSIFCRRDRQNTWCTVNRLFLILAYQMAEAHTSYRDAIVEILRSSSKGKVLAGVLSSQIDELFAKALAGTVAPLLPHLISTFHRLRHPYLQAQLQCFFSKILSSRMRIVTLLSV